MTPAVRLELACALSGVSCVAAVLAGHRLALVGLAGLVLVASW